MFSQDLPSCWFMLVPYPPYLATSHPRAAAVRAALALDAAADLELLELDPAKTPPRHCRDGAGHSLQRWAGC